MDIQLPAPAIHGQKMEGRHRRSNSLTKLLRCWVFRNTTCVRPIAFAGGPNQTDGVVCRFNNVRYRAELNYKQLDFRKGHYLQPPAAQNSSAKKNPSGVISAINLIKNSADKQSSSGVNMNGAHGRNADVFAATPKITAGSNSVK